MQLSFKKHGGWVVLVWSLPPILSTIGILNRTPAQEGSADFFRILALQATLWYPWVALTWLIWWLLQRWPMHGSERWLHLAKHTLCACAIALTLQAYLVALELMLAKGLAAAFSPEQHAHAWRRVSPSALILQVVLYAIVAAAGMALNFYHRSKRQELQWANDRLQMLAQQLQPHFLFNTLHSVSTLIDKDPTLAKNMLAKLSHLLRASLDKGEVQEITLAEELALLDYYLDIQKVRFSDRLTIEMEIAKASLGAMVPPLLLQPLVENAIRHGLGMQGGRIGIRAEMNTHCLSIRIRDEGPGFKVFDGWQGIGLSNCRSRLQVLYGTAASLRLRNLPKKGAEVALELPVRGKQASEM